MYLFPTFVKNSEIEGKGVFASQEIRRGAIVWKFVPEHDLSMSVEEYEKLDEGGKKYIDKVAYLSAASHRYIYPPENDPALYTNHSRTNNLSVVMDDHISPEPHFVANRDIAKDEELTNNYLEFDTKATVEREPYL